MSEPIDPAARAVENIRAEAAFQLQRLKGSSTDYQRRVVNNITFNLEDEIGKLVAEVRSGGVDPLDPEGASNGLTERVDDALFHDTRLWFMFTDRFAHLGGPAQARQAAAQVAVGALRPAGACTHLHEIGALRSRSAEAVRQMASLEEQCIRQAAVMDKLVERERAATAEAARLRAALESIAADCESDDASFAVIARNALEAKT